MLSSVIMKEFKNATPKALELLDDPSFDVNACVPGSWSDHSIFMEVVKGCCKHGNFSVFDKMIKDPRLNINYVTYNASALFCAIEGGCPKTFKRLLEHPEIKLSPLIKTGSGGVVDSTIFRCAAFYSSAILEILIECGKTDLSQHLESAIGGAFSGDDTIRSLKVIMANCAPIISNTGQLRLVLSKGPEAISRLLCNEFNEEMNRLTGECLENPVALMKQMRLELGYSERDAATLFVACQKSGMRITNEKGKIFFAVARRLPPELQMRLCNLAYGVNKEFIKGSDIEHVLDSLKTEK